VPGREGRTWLVAVPLALLVIAAFLPVLDNGFVDLDDAHNFLSNPYYRGLGIAQVHWAWSTFRLGVYQPLAWLILEAEYAVWGLDPRGYHLISLLWHAANAVVLYVLTVTVLARCQADPGPRSPWAWAFGAGLATALYAVHPLRVEAVAWASCQPYLPCALFSMLAVLAYLRAVGRGPSPDWGWLVGSFVLFAAALLSKAPAVTLPAVLLILDVYPLRRLGGGPGRWFGAPARKVYWEKVPFVLLSLVFMGLAIAARKHVRAMVPIERYGTSARIAQACYGIWLYIVKTVLPLDVTALYPSPQQVDWLAAPFLLSILGTVVTSVGLWLLRRRRPGLLAAWVSYLVILSPNLGLIRVSNQLAADRYSYMAMLGGVMLAAAGFCRSWPLLLRARPGAIGIVSVSLGALLGLVLLTWDQCRIWSTSEVLWTHALNHGAARSTEAHNNLGVVLSRQGKLAEAAAHYAEALRISPGYAGSHNNLGLLLSRQGKFAEATAHYTQALRFDPDDAEVYNNLAMMLAACPEATYRDGKKAVEFATRACALSGWQKPEYLDTLAAASAEAGDFDAAVAWQAKAIALLMDQRQEDDYGSRLALYRAKKPYREGFPGTPPP
jgi:tetratricopeptide (TPR) repeat protein